MSKTTPTKDSIRAEFEELVEKDSFWSKFVGSQFVSMLTLFITQIVYRCFQYADAALAEGFISTATRRSSILAAAETNSYVGTKPTPSSGMIEITATSEDAPAVIPKNMPLISDDQYPYMTMDVCRLVDGTGTVEVAQLEIQEVTYTVTAAKEFLEVVLSKALTAVCYKLEVFVTTDGKTTQWSSSTMFRLAGSKSQVYVEFYKPSEQLGVRFGDGLIGQIPPEGSTITLKVWCTNGDITLVAGQNLTPVDSAANLANLISVKTTTPITAGTDAETTEITRIQLTDPDGSVYMIKAKSIQGVDMADAIGKLFKAYKAGNVSEYLVQPEEHKPENVEPESAEDTGSSSPEPEVSVGAYRYALQMRPAAPGAIPEGNKAILPRPDEGDPYYEYARYGIATYDTPLSDQQMSEYDLKLLPREDSFDFLAKTLTNGPFGKYAQKALELATNSPDEFRVMLKTQFQKTFPNIAFPGGAGTEKMVQSMINALQAEVGEITQPEPAPAQPDETVSEADAEANKAIEYLNNVMDMQSTDMAEIRNARGNVREAIAALQTAGRFEENEELVNGAARHLADLLVAIQKAGVAA